MREVILFLSGIVLTLILVGIGFMAGYFYGAKEDKLEERRKRIEARRARRRNKGEASGSITPKQTVEDAEAEERRPFTDRLRQLGAQEPPDDGTGFIE